jgi:hypothetical protein
LRYPVEPPDEYVSEMKDLIERRIEPLRLETFCRVVRLKQKQLNTRRHPIFVSGFEMTSQ